MINEVKSTISDFWVDFEILLERQFQLENEALSHLGRIENANSDPNAICRFDKSQVASLIWNFFIHLSQAKERIINLENSKKIYQIMRKGL